MIMLEKFTTLSSFWLWQC